MNIMLKLKKLNLFVKIKFKNKKLFYKMMIKVAIRNNPRLQNRKTSQNKLKSNKHQYNKIKIILKNHLECGKKLLLL